MNYSRILVAVSLPFLFIAPACDGPFSSMGNENGGTGPDASAGGNSSLGAGGVAPGSSGGSGGISSGGACPGMPAIWPICTSGATPVAQYNAQGCQTGYVCPDSPDFCACAGDAAKVPAQICLDGSTSGTICVTNDDGTCEWISRGCPTEGAGGAGPGSTPPSIGSCVYNGVTIAVGSSVKAADGCNTCYCETATGLSCTTMWCGGAGGTTSGTGTSGFAGSAGSGTSPTTCMYAGRLYAVGISFQSTDGCNSCSCTSGGLVACTAMACGGAGGASSGATSTVVCPAAPVPPPICTTTAGSGAPLYDANGCIVGYACP